MIPYLKQGAQAISGHAQLRSSTTAAGKLYAVIRFRNRFELSWQKTHFFNSLQAERHLVLPITNAGAHPAAHFALARALRGAARSLRAVCIRLWNSEKLEI